MGKGERKTEGTGTRFSISFRTERSTAVGSYRQLRFVTFNGFLTRPQHRGAYNAATLPLWGPDLSSQATGPCYFVATALDTCCR
jgi:hypothetical protein